MKKQKFLAALLVLAMVLTLAPVTAFAAETDIAPNAAASSSGMVVTKTATPQADGTYTIELSAYATGTTVTTVIPGEKTVPLDVVLVIDQSGSMTGDLADLKTAVADFVDKISANAAENNVDHRIAVVGFASNLDDGNSYDGINGNKDAFQSPGSSNTYWVNTGLFVNGQMKNYAGNSETSSLTADDYKNALVSVNTNGQITSSVTTAIANLAASGATRTSYGLEMANKVFENNPLAQGSDRKRVVVLFTDGAPGRHSYQDQEAVPAVQHAYTAKNTYNADVYSIGFVSNPTTDVSNFLNYISSNYPDATGILLEEDQYISGMYIQTIYTAQWTPGEPGEKQTYYIPATSSSELGNIFTTIGADIVINESTTTATLTETAVLRDVMGSNFDLPDGYNSNNVTAAVYRGEQITDKIVPTFDEEPYTGFALTVNINEDANTVEVSGLDYAENYIAWNHPGYKLVVTIKGVMPKLDAPTNTLIATNLSTSGIYEDANAQTPAVSFTQPLTMILSKSYVMDYAKTMSADGLSSDSLKTVIKSGPSSSNYGTFTAYADGKFTYTPTTTQWDGYDSMLLFGTTETSNLVGVTANHIAEGVTYAWSKVNVIPANNVYYEDDFVTNEANGTVGIEYGGDWKVETSTGSGNTETPDDGVHGGWTNAGLANDDKYSDGSAHVAGAARATATFTFTGTGVDIYSSTNATAGGVRALVYQEQEDGSWKNVLIYYVDNTSQSGDYYQIPTLSIHSLEGETKEGKEVEPSALPYGKYKVELTAYAIDGNATYCLDGIRIYNPAQEAEKDTTDTTVNDAYQEDDALNAVFQEVRDILLDANSFTGGSTEAEGVVFIDEITDETSGTTSVIGTYEELGPKNEVYLDQNQSIAFKLDTGNTYAIGLKAPNGATAAQITNGSDKSALKIKHSTDLFYGLTPNESGYVVIKNTGANLLAVTKLQITNPGAAAEAAVMSVSEDEIMGYAMTFSALSLVDYEEPAAPEETTPETTVPEETTPETTVPEETTPETTVPEETTPETKPEAPDIDIEIENPDPKPEHKPAEAIRNLVKKLFSFISKWF